MSKTALTEVHLVNWYGFIDEKIPISPEMTMIIGENGSGKSTILDAIKYVFDGDTEFNYSASSSIGNARRTIWSYTRGLIDSSMRTCIRPVETCPTVFSHIALGYHDEFDNRDFVIGTILETGPANDVTSYWYSLDHTCLSDLSFTYKEDGVLYPYDNKRFQETYHARLMPKTEGIQKAMQMMGLRLNADGVHEFQRRIRNMSAYRPTMNIREFIRKSVLEQNDVNFTDLTEKKAAIDRLAGKLKTVEERMNRLTEIIRVFGELDQVESRLNVNAVKTVYRDLHSETENSRQFEEKAEAARIRYEQLDTRLKTLQEEAGETDSQLREAKADLTRVDGARAIETAKEERSARSAEAEKLSDEKQELETFEEQVRDMIQFLGENGRTLKDEETLLQLTAADVPLSAKIQAVGNLRQEVDSLKDSLVSEKAIAERDRDEIREEILRLQGVIDSCAKNRADYSEAGTQKALVQAINRELRSQGIDAEAKMACEYVVDIRDEAWRDAIEAFLGWHRYAVIVPEAYYDIADKIHDQRAYRYVELVNTPLLMHWDIHLEEHPVSSLLEIQNEIARRYFDYHLGGIRMASFEEVGRFPSAMTKEGKMSRGMGIRYVDPRRIQSYCLGSATAALNRKRAEAQMETARQKEAGLSKRIRKMESGRVRLSGDLALFRDRNYDVHAQYGKCMDEVKRLDSQIRELEEALRNNTEYMMLSLRVTSLEKKQKEIGSAITETMNRRADERAQQRTAESGAEMSAKRVRALKEQYDRKCTEHPEAAARAKMEYDLFLQGTTVYQKYSTDVISPDRKNRLEGQFREMGQELSQKQADYNASVEPENHLDLGREAENQYRAVLNRIRMNDIENISREMEKEKKQYEVIFRNEFALEIYRRALRAKGQIEEMNRSLRKLRFSTQYSFRVNLIRDGSDQGKVIRFAEYLDERSREDNRQLNLFDAVKAEKTPEEAEVADLEQSIREMVGRITSGEGETIRKLADYREYMTYEIRFSDAEVRDGSLSKQIGFDSGAYRQIPFTIILASSLSMIYDGCENSVRLFFMDEPFEKMSQSNVHRMIEFFRERNFQVIFCAADKLDSIGEDCDLVVPVLKYSRGNMRTGEVRFRRKEAR